jgi:hypothetical protein
VLRCADWRTGPCQLRSLAPRLHTSHWIGPTGFLRLNFGCAAGAFIEYDIGMIFERPVSYLLLSVLFQ